MSEKISDQSVPVQEIKTPTVISVKKFMKSVLVVLLSFMCICVGILIYQLHEDFHPIYGKNTKTEIQSKRNLRGPEKVSKPILKQKKIQIKENAVKSLKVEKKDFALSSAQPMMSMPLEQETAKDSAILETKKNTEIELKPVNVEVKENILPLSVALDLRDKLIIGETCTNELSLLVSENLPKTTDKTKILNALMPVCTDTSFYNDLKNVFNQEKKDALATFYRMTSSSKWTAYMKSIWTSLVDVRRLNPVKKRPKDIVSLAQNALEQYNIGEAIILVQKLPPEMQSDFRVFLEQAKVYILAQEAVDSLVFAYEVRGK